MKRTRKIVLVGILCVLGVAFVLSFGIQVLVRSSIKFDNSLKEYDQFLETTEEEHHKKEIIPDEDLY